MSEESKIRLSAKAEEIASDIFDLALLVARGRLETIGKDEAEDTMEFDRAARTALALVRIASEVDALTARKRKEESGNEKDGGQAGADYAEFESELIGRLSRYVGERRDGGAERAAGGSEKGRRADHKSGRAAS